MQTKILAIRVQARSHNEPQPGGFAVLWERWFHRDWSFKLQASSRKEDQRPKREGPSKAGLFVGVCLQTKILAIRVQARSHNGLVDGMVALFPYANIESITPSYISFSL